MSNTERRELGEVEYGAMALMVAKTAFIAVFAFVPVDAGYVASARLPDE